MPPLSASASAARGALYDPLMALCPLMVCCVRSTVAQTLEGHADVVLGVAAHPTKELIATGGTDKDGRSIRVWENQIGVGGMAPPPAPAGSAIPATAAVS